jgi:POTRA domain, FtsQ-type
VSFEQDHRDHSSGPSVPSIPVLSHREEARLLAASRPKRGNVLKRLLSGQHVPGLFQLKAASRFTTPPTLSDSEVALKSVPESILDEIKINAPLSETTLTKARHRQELFLRKRRESKRQSIWVNRVMVAVRLLSSAVLLGLWVVLWQSPIWDYHLQNTEIRFESLSQQGFLNLADLRPILKPYSGQRIYEISPQHIADTITKRFSHVDHAIVRRQLFPATLDVTIVEKPIWATYYRLAKGDSSSLSMLLSRYEASYPKSPGTLGSSLSLPPFRYVTLLHTAEGESAFEFSKLTPPQKTALLAYPAVFVQGKNLDALQRKSLEEVIHVIQSHRKHFEAAGYTLRCVDARNSDDVFLVFNGFQARLGRLDYTASRRVNRLVQLLDTIHQYQDRLAWVELSWQGQITFKLK